MFAIGRDGVGGGGGGRLDDSHMKRSGMLFGLMNKKL